MSDYTRHIADLSPEKLDALLQHVKNKQNARGSRSVIKPYKRESNTALLSLAQQRLWFLDQLVPGLTAYNIPIFLRLSGRLNVEALEQSINEIVRRHEVLRTTFLMEAGQPVQVIAPFLSVPLMLLDLSDLPEREVEAQRQATAEAGRPFDLTHGPLVRSHLLRLGEQEHILLITVHHICFDGWSVGVFFQELSALYAAYTTGRASPLRDLPIQYADFAAWLREWLASCEPGEGTHTTLETQIAYWQRQLKDAPAALELPTDFVRPAIQTYQGSSYSFLIPQSLSESLRRLSQREGVTLFMTLLTGFQVLLARYSGGNDIVVGTDVANRSHTETELLIGFFVNQLVLRADLSDDPSFRDLLARVRTMTLESFAHQDVPFDHLVGALQPERDLGRNPLFQVLFTLQKAAIPIREFAGITLSLLGVERHTALFDLSLVMIEGASSLRGTFEYNSDLFKPATLERMTWHYQTVLEEAVADPRRRVSQLPLLTEQEQRQTFKTLSHPSSPDSTSLIQLFEIQVQRRPDAVAVSDRQGQLSYQTLAQQVQQMARRLRLVGVGVETLVALLLPRGCSLMIAMLAVFKAGGAYVPLDPFWPTTRQHQVLKESGTQVLVSTVGALSLLDAGLFHPGEQEILLMEQKGDQEQSAPASHRADWLLPERLAYVIYTSGSTGVPKGAMIEQRGMLNHLWAKIEDLGLRATDIVAQTASQSFDISVWQHLAALLVGGRVHVIAQEITQDPLALIDEVERQQISILEVVPSLLSGLMSLFEQARDRRPRLERLRWLILTGEALSPELCRGWLSLYPHIPLLNAYGPTECSDDVTHQVIREPLPPEAIHTPIGRAVRGMQLYVLSETMIPQPINIPGELFVGGVGVGRGYLGDGSRTAERFVPDPFSQRPGARLYRTGDRVRYNQDGVIEYLGRRDSQVKLRGYRIELGEIEAVLCLHPAVRQAIVVAQEEQGVTKQLVAYQVAREGAVTSTSAIRAYMKERLPDYMVPASFVWLQALPLTSNGKIDRKSLPSLEQDRGETVQEQIFVAPRTSTEILLTEIWADVLQRKHVGIHDNFFDSGGDSILSTQIAARAYQANLHLTPMDLFQHQTIAALAKHIKSDMDLQAELVEPTNPVSGQSGVLSAKGENPPPVDFPEAGLSWEQLHDILSTLDDME